MITTIEPRVFGSEAEYMNRLKQRRDSCPQTPGDSVSVSDLDIQRHSVIVNPSQLQDGSRDNSPSPSLSLLPSLPVTTSSITSSLSSFDSYLESSSQSRLSEHPSDQQNKLLLKEEQTEVVNTKVEQLFLSSEFGGGNGGGPPPSQPPSIPNFLTFTPDESVTQSMLSQCNKHESSADEILRLVDTDKK